MKSLLSIPLRILIACILIGLLNACQVAPPLPTPSVPPTQLPSAVPSPSSTPTLVLPTEIPTETSRLGVSPEELRGKRVHFWYSGSQAVLDEIEAQILDFNGTNPSGIWVDGVALGSDGELAERIQPVLGSAEQPDLILTPLILALSWQKPEVFTDPSSYLDDPVYGLSEDEQENIPPGFWSEGEVNNRRISMPGFRNMPLLAYNQTWALELGYQTPPSTPDEFKEQACAASQALLKNNSYEDNGLGGWIVDSGYPTAVSWLAAFGATPFADGEGKYNYVTPQAEQAFTFLRGMFEDGCAWVSRNPDPYGYFTRRQALFYSTSVEDFIPQEAAMTAAGDNDQWSLIAYPSINLEPGVYTDGSDYLILGSTPAEQLAAWIFERWMLSPQRQAASIQKTGLLPVQVLEQGLLSQYAETHPQWAQAYSLMPKSMALPTQPAWLTARVVLQDAFNTIFSSTPQAGDIPAILNQLNQTILELQDKKP